MNLAKTELQFVRIEDKETEKAKTLVLTTTLKIRTQ